METTEGIPSNKRDNFLILLQDELEGRIKRNPSYSLRAFARTLDVSHAALSQILNGKRNLSKKMIVRLGLNLGLNPEELLHYTNTYTPNQRPSIAFSQEGIDNFKVLSGQIHNTILELIYLDDFNPDYRWIAQKLDVSVNEVNGTVSRLIRQKYLEIDEEGRWKDLTTGYTSSATDSAFTNAAKKNLQKELFSLATQSIDNHLIEDRSHSGVTIAIDRNKVEEVRGIIKKFRRELTAYIDETTSEKNDVYQLCIAFFPLTNKNKNKNENENENENEKGDKKNET